MRALKWLFFCLFISNYALAADVAPSVASITRSQTVTEGTSLTLEVSANGTAPFTFQWKKDGAVLTGATQSILVIDPVKLDNEASYTVVVTNSVGSIESSAVLIGVTPATTPTINYQPSTVQFTIGNSFSLSASVSGTTPITYEWKKDGEVVYTGGSYYSVSNATASHAGTYVLTATNYKGAATSNPITVYAETPVAPTITTEPADRTVDPGNSLSIYMGASGTQPMRFDLYRAAELISSQSYSSFYISSASEADEASYSIKVTNSAGTVTSRTFTVTVNPPLAPTTSISPTALNLSAGQSLYLSSSISGTAPFTYQWSKDGVPISGAANYSYSKSNVTLEDTGSYSLTVTNSAGTVTSSPATVSVTNPTAPLITQHPTSRAVRSTESSYLTVSATGTAPLSYQWYRDGVAISGATSSYYYGSPPNATGDYTVKVNNSVGETTSYTAHIAAWPKSKPVFTNSLSSQMIDVGSSFSIYSSISAEPAATYQWYKDGVALPGQTSSSLNRSSAANSDSANYTLVATNSEGSTTSNAATITVATLEPPLITRHPASLSLLPGNSSSLNVSVAATVGATYQWYKDSVLLAGKTSSSLSLSGQTSENGSYTVVVTNASGTATSEPATVTTDIAAARPVFTYRSGSIVASTSDYTTISFDSTATIQSIVWKLNGVVILNASSRTLSFNPSYSPVTAGAYTATVTTADGTFTSPPINVTVRNSAEPPRFTSQPLPADVLRNSSVQFSVSVQGTGPFTYQWQKDEVDIPLANASYLTLSNVISSYVGAYRVKVTGTAGSVTSQPANLTIREATAPVIATHPTSMAVSTGSSLNLSFSYLSNDSSATIQWHRDGEPIANATGTSLYLNSASVVAGSYTATVTNSAGSATTYPAVITIVEQRVGPVFTTQPIDLERLEGESATFTAAATSSQTVSYQWRFNGVAIADATSATLTLTAIRASDAGLYTVVATDAIGAASSLPATLTVQPAVAPTISSQPSDSLAIAGDNVTIAVSAGGVPAPSYQWYHNNATIPGATTATLSLPQVTSSQAGSYFVVVTNAAGSATSRTATLEVFDRTFESPAITTDLADVQVPAGYPATLELSATGYPSPTFDWFHDNRYIGTTTSGRFTIDSVQASDVGSYQVHVKNRAGSVSSREASLAIVEVPLNATFHGTFGNNGIWALHIDGDRRGTLMIYLPDQNQVIYRENIVINDDGSFTSASDPATAMVQAASYSATATAEVYFNGTVNGSVVGSAAVFNIPSLGLSATTARASDASAANYAGAFDLVPLGDAAGIVHLIAAEDGQVISIAIDQSGITPATGTVSASGTLLISGSALSVSGQIGSSGFTGTLTTPATGEVVAASPAPTNGAERLANLSTRLRVSGADTVVVGFVVQGSADQDVMVRAVGPTLDFFDVTGVMPNPSVGIFSGQTQILENDDWSTAGNVDAIAAVAQHLGAFALKNGSHDAVALAKLAPGPYTAHVTDVAKIGGVVLIEVYDGNATTPTAPRLVNLSARGLAGTGDQTLIAGFVVTGDAPKRFLIRGIGPTLGGFGVDGTLADPQLQVFRGQTVVASNGDWGQAADPVGIATQTQNVGAFALTTGSKDAALLVYLAPGAYSAQVRGQDGATGEAMVEIYEVP